MPKKPPPGSKQKPESKLVPLLLKQIAVLSDDVVSAVADLNRTAESLRLQLEDAREDKMRRAYRRRDECCCEC